MRINKKRQLLQSGFEVFLQKGYHGAGLSDILRHAGVPKGSFYHYFENKQEFLIEVLAFYVDNMNGYIHTFLDNQDKPALDRFQELISSLIELSEADGCKGGCLMGNVAQELTGSSEQVCEAVKSSFAVWVDAIEQFFQQAKADGGIAESYDTRALADMFIDGWQGALLRMKVESSTEPLKRFLKIFMQILG